MIPIILPLSIGAPTNTWFFAGNGLSLKIRIFALLKRFLSISLLVLYLFTATECNQLLKFPVLLEHYSEHKEQNDRISFIDFLQMHYAGYDFNDNDQDRDMQLPFKSHNDWATVNAETFPPPAAMVALRPCASASCKIITHHRLNFRSSYLSAIWQPPKA